MDRAVSTLDAAVAGGHMPLARRSLGEVSNEAERSAALDALARHAATGAPVAVELLIEAIDRWGVARTAVRKVLIDDSAVDVVTQDTLIVVAQSVASFPARTTFISWLHQMARSRAADHLRRVRAGAAGAGAGHHSEAEQVSSLVVSDPGVRALVDQLPERYRDAVVLRDVERLPLSEAAVRLGRNVDTVKAHVARGRALLAGLLARDVARENG
jgi:RNA polymerase sigma-70 factor (ECF subfamily)